MEAAREGQAGEVGVLPGERVTALMALPAVAVAAADAAVVVDVVVVVVSFGLTSYSSFLRTSTNLFV